MQVNQQKQDATPSTPPVKVESHMGDPAGAGVHPECLQSFTQVGSLMYMSPELVCGNQYNEKVDVFSFGIICE